MADDAFELLRQMLESYNLPQDLIDGAWAQYTQGKTAPEVLQWVREQPAYAAAFPGINELRAKGSKYGNEGAYAQYVAQAKEMAHAYGMPVGVYDQPDDFVEGMKRGVSPEQLNNRYQMAAAAVYTMPQEVRDSLTSIAGVGTGGLIAYYLDADRSIPVLERQFQAAQVMGAGKIAGVDVDAAKADRLAELGITYAQAQQGFGQVAALAGLSSGLGAAETVSQEKATDAVLGGDAASQAALERTQKSRQARFAGGGGAVTQSTGATGLGTSRST